MNTVEEIVKAIKELRPEKENLTSFASGQQNLTTISHCKHGQQS